MSKAEIKITGIPQRMPQIYPEGDVVLIFKTVQTEGDESEQSAFESFVRVLVKKNLWKTIAKEVNESTYYIIEGIPKASLNNKKTPFISVLCSSIKAVNGLKKDNTLQEYNAFSGELPEDTDEVVPASSISISEKQPVSTKAKDKALKYFMKHGTFDHAVVVKKDTMILVSGYEKYLVAKELNMGFIPVSYDTVTGPEAKDEKLFRNTEWYMPEEVTELDVQDIILTEDVHLSVQNFVFRINLKHYSESGKISIPVAVRPLNDGKYSLVTGAARYFAAKILNIPRIPAVITDMGHDEFVKSRFLLANKDDNKDGKFQRKIEGQTLISLITVPKTFLESRPNPAKIKETIEYYKKHGQFDKPIVIRGENNLLVDGYKRYVAAKEMNLTSVWTVKRR